MPRLGTTYNRWKYDSKVPMPLSTFYDQKKRGEKRKRCSDYIFTDEKDINFVCVEENNTNESIYDDVISDLFYEDNRNTQEDKNLEENNDDEKSSDEDIDDELLHLVDCTQDFGPLNLMNCFQFEELNRKVVGFIHGRDLMGEEFIKIFNLIQGLMSNFSLISPQSVFYDFIKNEIKFKTSNKKNSNTNDRSVKKSNRIKELTDENLRKTVKMKLNLTDADIDRIEYYNKFF